MKRQVLEKPKKIGEQNYNLKINEEKEIAKSASYNNIYRKSSEVQKYYQVT